MSIITILHLSDIHFKKKKDENKKIFREQVRGGMIEAIKNHLTTREKGIDFVAVTGDIAFSGKEYQEAQSFFRDLKKVLPKNIRFLVVPGNHDVDRSRIVEIFPIYENIIQKDIIEDFLGNKEHVKNFVNVKFRDFIKFAKELNPSLYNSKEDYFWVANFADEGVSFLGLNSCWASKDDSDRYKIALGYPQLIKALGQSTQKNKILLMHHPLYNWFYEKDFEECENVIFRNCSLVLHGHTHRDNAKALNDPDSSCIYLGVKASYTQVEDGYIGFQFIQAEFREERTTVNVWPYRFSKEPCVRFVPDNHRWESQEGKAYFEISSGRLSIPHEEESKERGSGEEPESFEFPKRIDKSLVIPSEYKEWVHRFHSTMDIDLLAAKGEVITVNLPEVYIPIETADPFFKSEELHLEHMGRPASEPGIKKNVTMDIEELVGRKKCVLLRGGAGMGKTTLIKHLAYTVTHGSCPPILRTSLPVVVFLKNFWPIYIRELEKDWEKTGFEDLLVLYLEQSKCLLTRDVVNAYLKHQKVLFLIDGLDEVPVDFRSALVDIIAEFRNRHPENRFLLTGRPHGIAGRAETRFGGPVHDIEPLNDRLVGDFIIKWFLSVSGRAVGLGVVTAEGMISDMQQNQHLYVFSQVPLLLTAVCILYQDGKRIPDQRAELYSRVVDNLISRRFYAPTHPDKEHEVLEFLMCLAFNLQEKNLRSIEIENALEILGRKVPEMENERKTLYQKRIRELFNEIEQDSGLFNRLSSGKVEFSHLTFQEFLAARHMVYMGIDWKQFVEEGWWEETLLLYTGLISIDRKREANDIIETILTIGEKEDGGNRRLQLLAGKALYNFQTIRRETHVVSRTCEKLYRLIGCDAELGQRIKAGIILGGLGDSRIVLDNMVPVPAGEFIRGSNDMEEQEKPEQHIFLDGFMIGKYPVTNQEYKSFISDNGYHKEEFWTHEGWLWRMKENISEPRFWRDRKWNGPNFPVVGIGWYEAVAYANWLSSVSGENYRLPSEAEWEKAARGTDGKRFPWGNDFDFNKDLCNSKLLNLRKTTPVGIFPRDKSIFGCFDMAGNVHEWCADWYDKDYYKIYPLENPVGPSNGSDRVFRGGSWGYGPDFCRVARRFCFPPNGLRFGSVGFRLVKPL